VLNLFLLLTCRYLPDIIGSTMKKRYKIFTQEDFGAALGIPQPRVSRILNGIEPVSWQLAVVLDSLFPGKGVVGWKHATGEDMKRLYKHLKLEAEMKERDALNVSE
jgi:plasmid maintenance system antidote protein VapI